jgi:acetyl/propionyl-CoA carboxylase alpha subunit
MLGKLVVWAADRPQAIERMIRAIQEMNVGGVSTSLPAALQVLEHERFRSGDYDTHFLESLTIKPPAKWLHLVAAAAAIHRHDLARRKALAGPSAERAGWVARGRNQNADRGIQANRSTGSFGGQA